MVRVKVSGQLSYRPGGGQKVRWKELAGAAAVLALSLGATGCGEEPPQPEEVARPIKMLTIGGGLSGIREYPGRIRAVQQADMGFEVAGRIVEFVYKEGERVEKGAMLARLDPRDYENALEQARAVENRSRTYLKRIAQAHKTGAVSDQDLTNAQAALEVSSAEVKIRQKGVNDTKLRAPFDGIMSRKLVQDFANVQAKEPVLIFEDDSRLEIKVSVPERDLAGRRPTASSRDAMNARLKPKVTVTALPDLAFPAKLKELATTADPTTRTYEATFLFDQPNEVVVLPGMTAKVTVQLSDVASAGEVAIPAHAAVADTAGRSTVWVVDPESMTVKRKPVTLGQLTGDSVIVTAGLSNGEVVAISGVSQLREGMAVRRWER
jgi:RND family efflux transporter MFP subunit